MLELKMIKTFALGQKRGMWFVLGLSIALVSVSAGAQSEGQALHVFVGKSVVINVQAPVTRILSSNPAVIDTLATSPTQIVVEGKAAGSSSLIFWDATGHSQMLDVTVDVNIAHLRTAIEQTFPSETINVQSDGAHLILTGTVSEAKIADDVGKMAASYSGGVVNSLTVAPVHE
jgi:pilus assembly protein CpaC